MTDDCALSAEKGNSVIELLEKLLLVWYLEDTEDVKRMSSQTEQKTDDDANYRIPAPCWSNDINWLITSTAVAAG